MCISHCMSVDDLLLEIAQNVTNNITFHHGRGEKEQTIKLICVLALVGT
jgi:hypothetical protein